MPVVKDDSPSRTAYGVAMSRAAHQIFDLPRVFEDPAALTILGPKITGGIRAAKRRFNSRYARYLRAFLVARSRLAEEALSEAVARGVRQYVLLGAGLDTFAYRNPHVAGGAARFRGGSSRHPGMEAAVGQSCAAQIPRVAGLCSRQL